MSSKGWDITPKKGPGGAGKATEEEKNEIINKAVSKWKEMGLSDELIAHGIATMNVESGFNPGAKNTDPESTAKGLGQFTDDTWKDAVNYYNKKHRAEGEQKIDPETKPSRENTDDQIKVMGAWLEHNHKRAVERSLDPRLKDYSMKEVEYALWHQGYSAPVESKDPTARSLKKFLDKEFNAGKEFKETYNTVWGDLLVLVERDTNATDGLPEIEDILAPGVMDRIMEILLPASEPSYLGADAGGYGETLRREGDQVWRIEPDGGTRGYFISE